MTLTAERPPTTRVTAAIDGRLDFHLPAELEADQPAEVRAGARDAVRLLVSHGRDEPLDTTFTRLPEHLREGDLLVVNTSMTVPAAVTGRFPDGTTVLVHLSTEVPGGAWLVELRQPDLPASRPYAADPPANVVALPHGGLVTLLARQPGSQRLWLAHVDLPGGVLAYLEANGAPVRYRHVPEAWPLTAYQTVYGVEPGSAEMPSAGRAFTPELLTALVARGVVVTPLVLHTGVSSPEGHEPPFPEWYRVPRTTAARVNATHADGGRVLAIGTTVVRALETVTDDRGTSHPGEGWTDVVITPERGVRTVDGLLTGWHEPRASHLMMLDAVGGREALSLAYDAALDLGYLWHEFGDLHLLWSPVAS
jgi:S-adenosylmethionine:tRNA ribosyltransferase-isomerase